MYFPLVSVIVPVYNVEKYLDRCIESIVNQTYKNLEIILVDDGSSDNSSAMCDKWQTKDSRIKVIHKENQGLGFARNTGIDVATGKYIFFWDSDDFVDITTAEKCVVVALANEADVVIFGRRDLYDDGKIIDRNISSTCKELFEKRQIVDDLLPSMFSYEKGFGSTACGKMFDLDVLKHLNQKFMSERQIVSEDSYFTLQLFPRLNRVAVIRDNLYYYCKRNNSLSRKYDKDRQKKNDTFLHQCIECAKILDLPTEIFSHIQARYHGMTLGTMAQIIRSDLSKKEKKVELKKIYHNDVLRKTLVLDVIKLDACRPRIFWICLKLKLYCLCTLLLKISKHR